MNIFEHLWNEYYSIKHYLVYKKVLHKRNWSFKLTQYKKNIYIYGFIKINIIKRQNKLIAWFNNISSDFVMGSYFYEENYLEFLEDIVIVINVCMYINNCNILKSISNNFQKYLNYCVQVQMIIISKTYITESCSRIISRFLLYLFL